MISKKIIKINIKAIHPAECVMTKMNIIKAYSERGFFCLKTSKRKVVTIIKLE